MTSSDQIELYLVLFRALEGTPFKDLAAKFKKELESIVSDTRVDYLGQKHPRDLNDLLARYPSLNFTNHLFSESVKDWLQRGVALKRSRNINVIKNLQARKYYGPVPITKTIPTDLYSRFDLCKRVMGHLSSAYCVCFDQTGQYVFTGADDHLIKIWSAKDGRLIKTLRGHDGHICDMSVNFENRLLASAGMDKIIRIWDLKTSKLLECLTSHSATVTSVKFAPYNRHGNDRYLITTSNDGTIVFWMYNVETFGFRKLKKFQERNRPGGQITCSSFSSGGSFLACGASDNFIHVYGFHPDIGPYWISELGRHKDKVDSVQFCNKGYRFISGSKDGTAIVWTFRTGVWEPLELDMRIQVDRTANRTTVGSRANLSPTVLIVQWSRDDRYVMTSLVDYSIKVWNSHTGELVHTLREHKHDIYLLESHPYDPRIFVSASHDGSLIIWDIDTGKCIKRIWNLIDSLEPPGERNVAAIYDIKFSPDGNMLAATDSHGYLSLYGNGSSEPYTHVPEEMFFHTDYRPLIRDVRHFVMDENTHVAPHLMPKPILVDMNGNPYPSRYQKLVPDHNGGERYVVPPLAPMQLKCLAQVIENHSRQEDEDYIAEKQDVNMYASDSDTIIDSDATEIDDEYVQINQPVPAFEHSLRSRTYGPTRERNIAVRERTRDRERVERERNDRERGDRERGDRERGDRERGDRERVDRDRGEARQRTRRYSTRLRHRKRSRLN